MHKYFLAAYHKVIDERKAKALAMKAESIMAVLIILFVFLAFYCALLSLQTTDEAARNQLLTSATGAFIGGLIVFICLLLYIVLRKSFVKED